MQLPKRFDLLDENVPVIFADGTETYNKLAETYVRHKKGYFILAPSGAGKTHFVDKQKEKHWIDGDVLWMTAKAHPEGAWWVRDYDEMFQQIDRRSDVITVEAKKLGFWIVGASNWDLVPDAIVIPHWSTHKKYVKLRETGNYDGGATSDRLEGLLTHRRWIARYIKKGVPKFQSVSEAAEFLASRTS